MTNLKTDIVNKIKSSPRFGDLFVNKNLQELLKERRFLFFTKNEDGSAQSYKKNFLL